MRDLFRFSIILLFTSLLVTSCKKDIDGKGGVSAFKTVDKYQYNVLGDWNDLFLVIEKDAAGYRPGPAANALGYLGLANYEACVSGMPEYRSLSGLYSGLDIPETFINQEYHWPTVVNAVNNFMYTRLFPEVDAKLFVQIKALADRNDKVFVEEVGEEVFNRSKSHGTAVAQVVWDYMKTDPITFDGYKDPFGNYDAEANYKKPGDWVPTSPGPGKGMFPFWGKGRVMAIKDDLRVCRPYTIYVGKFSEEKGSGLYNQAVEVMAQNTPELSYQTEWVGEFWSDDLLHLTFSPPSRWIAVANQVYNNEKTNLEKAIIANTKIGIALHDAAIGCWNSKYYYNLERPESYIKRVIDPTYEPNLYNPISGDEGISPSFPAYPSGHSTFGAAAAEVLAKEFGYRYAMTDNCHKFRTEFEGYPRSFNSFAEMADENAWSRVPLGVHFRMDAEEGIHYGTEIGTAVNNLPWKK